MTWLETDPEGWKEYVDAMRGGAMSAHRILAGDTAPAPHGRFASHTDLPTLTTGEAARMSPVFDAIYELIRQHPEGCGCDPSVMAWRAAYATAEILLRLPDAEGVFRKRYMGDVPDGYVYGWRCSKHPGSAIERLNKAWSDNGARKAYEDHMRARHPEGEGDDV